jgi:DNA adenine methylase
MSMLTPSRPILRWHGGKFLLAPWIIEQFPPHRVYVEPFGGAASVLLQKPRAFAEVYNDLDGDVVNLFRVCRERGEDLVRALELTPFAREEFALAYQPTEDPVEQARRLVVRCFMGFGSNSHCRVSGFRANAVRNGTHPANDFRHYPWQLRLMVERLKGVVIEHRDALQVIATHDTPQTLFYLDPPYVKGTRDKGRDYRHEMTDEDHGRLAKILHTIQGAAIISGYVCPLYRDLFAGWRQVARPTHADGARDRLEVLWLSPNCPDQGLFASA